MRNQIQNQGELKELTISIEKDVVESFERMSSKTGIPLDDLVVTALKRFKVSHSDFEGLEPFEEEG